MRTTLKKRIIVFCIALIMCVSCLPLKAFAVDMGTAIAVVTVYKDGNGVDTLYYQDSSIEKIMADIKKLAAEDNDSIELALGENWYPSSPLAIDYGVNLTIDLNGYSIDRRLTEPTENGEVLIIGANPSVCAVTVTDSSGSGNGEITGGNNSSGAGGIIVNYRTTFTLAGGSVCGNTGSTYGGISVSMSGSPTVFNMTGGSIAGNKGENGGGIAALFGATVNISGGEIFANNATAGDGGGIYVLNALSITTSAPMVLSYNTASGNGDASKGNGGGIFINEQTSKSFCLTSSIGGRIESNTAEGNGGGICVTKCNTGNTVHIKDASITKNIADYGGGIYIQGQSFTDFISGTVCENTGKSGGGGIYVNFLTDMAYLFLGEAYTKPKITITNNHDTDIELDNMCTFDCLNEIDQTSSIGVYPRDINSSINNETMLTYSGIGVIANKTCFYLNNLSYDVVLGGNAGRLMVSKTPRVNTELPDKYNGQRMISGVFSFPTSAGSLADRTANFYYSDGYFMSGTEYSGNANDYNAHLATMSLNMAMSSFGANEGGDDYTNKSQYVRALFTDIGMTDIRSNSYFLEQPTEDSMGVVIGHKTLPDQSILLGIGLRGANYQKEWASNVTVGSSGEHQGFSEAAGIVYAEIQDYISTYGLDSSKIKFWIAGYSRAGAVTNLTAKRLTDNYDPTGKRVFAYCFEPPMGGIAGTTGYKNIKNLVNRNDLVTYVAPAEMGFMRYGVDIMSPYDAYGTSGYWANRKKMLEQLGAVNNSVVFNDYFRTASFEYIDFLIGQVYDYTLSWADLRYDYPFIQVTAEDTYTQESFIKAFLESFQNYGLCYQGVDARTFYSTKDPWSFSDTDPTGSLWFESGDEAFKSHDDSWTLETALRYMIALVQTMDSEEKDNIIDSAISTLKGLPKFFSTDLSVQDLYDDVVNDWNNLSEYKYKFIMYELKRLLTSSDSGPGQYMTEEERTNIRALMPALITPLFYFLTGDYQHSNQELWGSLIHNADALAQAHYPEVTLAWLRTKDSFYDNDKGRFPAATAEDTSIDAPAASVDSGEYTASQLVTLSTKAKAPMIYYTLDGTDPRTSETAKLYTKPITIDMEEYAGIEGGANLQAYAKSLTNQSEVASYSYVFLSGAKYSVYSDGVKVAENFVGQSTLLLATKEKTIDSAPYSFSKWVLKDVDGTDHTSDYLGERYTNNIAMFSMPARDVYAEAVYVPVVTKLYLEVPEIAIGSYTPDYSWWMLQVGDDSICSFGWNGNYYPNSDSLNYVCDNANQLHMSWNNRRYLIDNTVNMSISLNSNQILRKNMTEQEAALLQSYQPFAISKNIEVTLNGEPCTVKVVEDTIQLTCTISPILAAPIGEMTSSVEVQAGSTIEHLLSVLPQKNGVLTKLGRNGHEYYFSAGAAYSSAEGMTAADGTEIDGWFGDGTGNVPTTPGTYSLRCAYDLAGAGIGNPDNYDEYGLVTFTVTDALPVDAPTADVQSGVYEAAQSVTLTSAGSFPIYYTLDGTDPAESGTLYSAPIAIGDTLSAGEDQSYTIKAYCKDETAGTKSITAEFQYDISIPKPTAVLTIECYDTNPAVAALGGDPILGTPTVALIIGEVATVSAPDVDDEQFDGWSIEDSEGNIISSDATSDAYCKNSTISFTMPDTAFKLRANYIPIVNKVNITMDAPEAGKPLSRTINSCDITVTNEYPMDTAYFTVMWPSNHTTAKWDTEYEAMIILTSKAYEEMKFTVSKNIQVTLNGETVSADSIVVDSVTGTMGIYVKFAATAKPKLTGTVSPDKIEGIKNGTAFGNIPLPDKVSINFEGGGSAVTGVVWQMPSSESDSGRYDYSPAKKDAQSFLVKGIVTLPDGVTAVNEADREVCVLVSVNAADTVAAPVATPRAGVYHGTIQVALSCATSGSKIYYTMDGSVPTSGSLLYTAPISLQRTSSQSDQYTIKAIAVKESSADGGNTLNYKDSSVATFGYTLCNLQMDGLFGQGGTLISPSSVVYDKYPEKDGLHFNWNTTNNPLIAIRNGSDVLVQGSDYILGANSCMITHKYLKAQPVGVLTLTFDMLSGLDPSVIITLIDSTPAGNNAALSPDSASYDKYTAAQGPSFVLTGNGRSLLEIRNGSTALVRGSDYTVNGNVYTITQSYLNAHSAGLLTLLFDMNGGKDPTLTIDISDSAPIVYSITAGQNAEWSRGDGHELTFSADGAPEKYVDTTVDGVQVDEPNLILNRENTAVTLKAAYLETLGAGEHILRINFTDGYAETTFTVLTASDMATGAANGAGDMQVTVVKDTNETGGGSLLWLWISLGALGAGGIATGIVLLEKKYGIRRLLGLKR